MRTRSIRRFGRARWPDGDARVTSGRSDWRPARRTSVVGLAVASVTLLVIHASLASQASAQTCRSARPHVVLELAGDWPDGERGAVTVELRAALEAQELELCLTAERAVARVRLERTDDRRVLIAIGDAVTGKRVERALDVSSFPPETRSLAVAIAADELLRASWAELLLVDAPPPAIEPPREVRAAVARSVPSVAVEPSLAWLDLVLPLERFGGGDLWLGGSLRAERWWAERVALRVGLGGRGAPSRGSALGDVLARALVAELDVLVGVIGEPERGLHLGVAAGVWTAWASYHGRALDGLDVSTARESGAVVAPRGTLFARYGFGAVRLGLELAVGSAVLGVVSTADGERVTGSHGALVQAILAFGVKL